jgi:hypothetical protein
MRNSALSRILHESAEKVNIANKEVPDKVKGANIIGIVKAGGVSDDYSSIFCTGCRLLA